MTGQKSQSHPGGLGIAPTMAAAASITKLPPEVITAAKENGCRAFRSNGNVDCDALLEWLEENPQPLHAAPEKMNLAVEMVLDKRAVRMTREHKLAEMKRQVIPQDEIKRTYTRSVFAAKSRLLSSEKTIVMESRMKLSLNDEQAIQLAEIISKQNRETMKAMSKGEWFDQKCQHCGKEI